MTDKDTMEIFEKAPVPTAVLKNTVPAMVAMMMVLVYNLADTFFIGQTHNDGGGDDFWRRRHFGNFQSFWPGPGGICQKGLLLLHVELRNRGPCADDRLFAVYEAAFEFDWSQCRHLGACQNLSDNCGFERPFCVDFQLLFKYS